jgi:hypothetical protein
MRHVLGMLVAVTSVLTVASPASAGPLHSELHSESADRVFVEHMLYATRISEFVAAVDSNTWFDWSTDLCSAPLVGSTGRTFNFNDACRRHDFGYRNLQLLDRRYGGGHWNSASRQRVDQLFHNDMRRHCWARPWYDEPTCLTWAETFYAAVRVAGGP